MINQESLDDERIHKMHAEMCQMLSNPTRLRILEQLCDEEKTVSELVEAIGVSQSNISQHLSQLRKKRLVGSKRDGSHVYYHLTYPKIMDACKTVREVLFDQMNESKRLIERGVNNE